jgi:hypothetical protein
MHLLSRRRRQQDGLDVDTSTPETDWLRCARIACNAAASAWHRAAPTRRRCGNRHMSGGASRVHVPCRARVVASAGRPPRDPVLAIRFALTASGPARINKRRFTERFVTAIPIRHLGKASPGPAPSLAPPSPTMMAVVGVLQRWRGRWLCL